MWTERHVYHLPWSSVSSSHWKWPKWPSAGRVISLPIVWYHLLLLLHGSIMYLYVVCVLLTEVNELVAVYSGVGKLHKSWWTDPKGVWCCKCRIWFMQWEGRFWAEFTAGSTAWAADSVVSRSCIVIILEKWLRCFTVLLLHWNFDCLHWCYLKLS